VTQGDFDLMVR